MISILLLLGASATFAADKCSPGFAKSHSVGATCETSRGHAFKLTGLTPETWQDQETGVVWGALLDTRFDRDRAKEACRKLRMELPDQNDFKTAESHGFREVLPDMKDHFYWTGTGNFPSKNARLLFNGNFGSLFWVAYNNIPYESVRCITRSPRLR